MSKLEIILVRPILEPERDVLLLEGKLREAQQTQAFNACYLSIYRTSWQHLNTTLFHGLIEVTRERWGGSVILLVLRLSGFDNSRVERSSSGSSDAVSWRYPTSDNKIEYLFKISHHKEFCNISELPQFQKMLFDNQVSKFHHKICQRIPHG